MNVEFMEKYEEAIKAAIALVKGIKNTGYNGGSVDIRDYWDGFDLQVLAYELKKKALRIQSLTHPSNTEGMKLKESLQDSCLDLINGAAFLYAEAGLREQSSRQTGKPFNSIQEAKEASSDGH